MNFPRIPFAKAGKAARFLCIAATGFACGVSTASAVNIAPLGTGRLGVNLAIDSSYGTPIANSGATTLINDGLFNNGVDTFNTANSTATVSFVGITWATPRLDNIVTLTLTMETFFDGGWFGPNSSGPGNGGTLTPTYLTDATVQFSLSVDPTAVGAVWTSVPATSNYLSVLNGHVIGMTGGTNPTVAPAATWTLGTPLTGITGIRLIGSEGGLASTQGGFIGVRELAVEAIPEPSAFLALMGGAALIGLLRRPR
jgi:hypothetical protein